MKKTILLLVLVAAFAFAVELTIWWSDGSGWTAQEGNKARCRKFATGQISVIDTTIPSYPIAIKNYAEVGQWMTITLTGGTDITHYVRKHGTFVGIGPVLNFSSNADVDITFANFNKLAKGTDSLDIRYFYDDGTITHPSSIGTGDWKTPEDLNSLNYLPATNDNLAFWQKLIVPSNAKKGQYTDTDATITLAFTGTTAWIDSDGNFTNLPSR